MSFLYTSLVLLVLYVVPGLLISRFISGRYRNNPFIWILGSCILVPLLYFILVFLKHVTFGTFLVVESLVLVFCTVASRYVRIDLDDVFKTLIKDKPKKSRLKILGFVILGLFFLSLLLARIGLWQGYLPVGDDKPRVGQVVSIAASPDFPVHFRLPTTEMSI